MNAHQERHIFIDESGDPYLETEKKGVSDFFVLSAVIVESGQLGDAEARAREVIRKHFQTGEMRSASVGSNVGRRERILKDIMRDVASYVSWRSSAHRQALSTSR